MSPKNKIKLNKLRKKLDNIDSQLLNLIKNRSEIVKKVLALKRIYYLSAFFLLIQFLLLTQMKRLVPGYRHIKN